MKFIPLRNKQGEVVDYAIVDDVDFEELSQWSWHKETSGYARRNETREGKTIGVRMHRQVMGFPKGQVDHKNHNRLDNRRENLRRATHGQNQSNRRRRPPKSGYRGVYPVPNGFGAYTSLNGRTTYKGFAKTAEEAARIYDKAAIEVYGEFATLNFPNEHVISAIESPPISSDTQVGVRLGGD